MNDKRTSDEVFRLLRGDGQPAFFVHLAVQVAASPQWMKELLRYTAFGYKPPRPFPLHPPIKLWLSMYRNHRSMQNALAVADGIPGDEMDASQLLDELRKASRMSQEQVAEMVAELTQETLRDFLQPFLGVPFPPDNQILRKMLTELDKEADSKDTDDEIDAVMANSTGQYWFRVWLPCWVLYREYPPILLRSARQGDFDALDKLLRLDKYIIGDSVIAKRIGDILTTGTTSQRQQLKAAIGGKPKKRLNDKSIRAGLAGLISQIAVVFKTQVTAPQIEELFNRIERIRTGNPTDPAVTTAETWSKSVQRNKNWPSLPTN